MKSYDPQKVEAKWQKRWEKEGVHEIDLEDPREKYYSLVMFPYPSGNKLHLGHWYQYGPVDTYARFMKMKGYNVLEPMGYDSFGLPAENYAIKTGTPPRESTMNNIEYMDKQFRRIGTLYDWSKKVTTSEPDYYKWTQWVFLNLYKKDLAYKRKAPVNWCPSCKTVLANEQVQDGTCDRCSTEVVKKDLVQWFFRIKDFAENLLVHDGLDWPEKTKLMQKNWIGKSMGCDVAWKVDGHDLTLETFTTTVDTIYGTTFVVISPEHSELMNIVVDEHRVEVEKYINASQKKTDIDRMAEDKEKTGVDTGVEVIHPFTGKKIPLWVADYVLMNYGTGVVMGVPAHDQRDMDFAKKYGFAIVQSIESEDGKAFVYDDVDKYNVKGRIIDSEEFTGLSIVEGRKKITKTLEDKGLGKGTIQYKLRDWLISRQRYWGAPIPIVYDPDGNAHQVKEEHLPWMLPTDVDYNPKGESPLASSKELVERTEKLYGKGWRPEVDTMDTFMCSSWYYMRYLSAHDDKKPFDPKILKKWMPVDMYIGGPEHACMHLLYARFIYKALVDDPKAEPFKRLVHQGLITKDGAKMSKSKGNVVAPDSFVEKYGSDVFRMYLMFMGPYTDGGDWNDRGITGVARFMERVWKLLQSDHVEDDERSKKIMHKTIKRVVNDIEGLHFNTAIAALMELLNEACSKGLSLESKQSLIKLMAPMAPHVAEEMWEMLGGEFSIFDQEMPEADPRYLVDEEVTVVVQVNGKLRDTMTCAPDISKDDALEKARELENIEKHIDGKEVIKEIFVPGKLVNFVIR
jgi:leucyl-tRNA synthetase